MLLIETANLDLSASDPDLPPDAAPGPYVLLTVSDTGMGIDEETRRHIFEPCFTSKKEKTSTGSGLATVYGIIHAGGGWISVSSEPNADSAFRIYIPRIEQSIPRLEQPTDERTPDATRPHAHSGNETILIVEDQPEVRRFAVEVLRGQGYRVLDVGAPSDAISALEANCGTVDLMIT